MHGNNPLYLILFIDSHMFHMKNKAVVLFPTQFNDAEMVNQNKGKNLFKKFAHYIKGAVDAGYKIKRVSK